MDRETLLTKTVAKYVTCKGMRELGRLPLIRGNTIVPPIDLQVESWFYRPHRYRITGTVVSGPIRSTGRSIDPIKLIDIIGDENGAVEIVFKQAGVTDIFKQRRPEERSAEKRFINGTDLFRRQTSSALILCPTFMFLEVTDSTLMPRKLSPTSPALNATFKTFQDQIIDFRMCHHVCFRFENIAREFHMWIDAETFLIKKTFVPCTLDDFPQAAVIASYLRQGLGRFFPAVSGFNPSVPCRDYYVEENELNPPRIDQSIFS